ncbi:MAG: bifunctional adenosylcobinamide kinase/adenosylcobinamide-phosphate guanylyltransferase [Desulfobacterales bacterium]|nr:bifunctional adenosylcobinamide kinase/adenosylcobinamide-phosphate guanylyltransferase [Desulfobacterales bacterium]
MNKIVFITGGCRSGKSSHALHLANKKGGEKYFIATCIPYDDEMRKRVNAHKIERGAEFQTIETPILLVENLTEISKKADIVIVDCLTLWINNLLMEEKKDEKVIEHIQELIKSIPKLKSDVIFVSNEVGCGIVPENQLARRFRDLIGFINQKLAASADLVIFMVSGIPVVIKG